MPVKPCFRQMVQLQRPAVRLSSWLWGRETVYLMNPQWQDPLSVLLESSAFKVAMLAGEMLWSS